MNVQIANVTLVDNGMGIMPIVYSPPSLSHLYADKTIHIEVHTKCFSVHRMHTFSSVLLNANVNIWVL